MKTSEKSRKRGIIVEMVKALLGAPQLPTLTTEKRRGYWYAECAGYKSGKGVNGPDGEEGAVSNLHHHVAQLARKETISLDFRRGAMLRKQHAAEEAEHALKLAREKATRLEFDLAKIRPEAAKAAEEYEAALKGSPERSRTLWSLLRTEDSQ